ncbi:MAG: ComF family protein [Muribaculum sp.]|nr:ComF family protein [Muribaculum sp.]
MIHRAKYSGRPKLARQLGRRFAAQLADEGFFDGMDMMVPVPMHWLKLIRRGYNQSEEICRGVSEVVGLPVVRLLEATRGHRTQTMLGGLGRWENLRDVYRVCDGKVDDLSGKHLLLVDDVLTTGATLLSCRQAIEVACRDVKVSVLTLGVTRLS